MDFHRQVLGARAARGGAVAFKRDAGVPQARAAVTSSARGLFSSAWCGKEAHAVATFVPVAGPRCYGRNP
jgi:hypothetical protein